MQRWARPKPHTAGYVGHLYLVLVALMNDGLFPLVPLTLQLTVEVLSNDVTKLPIKTVAAISFNLIPDGPTTIRKLSQDSYSTVTIYTQPVGNNR